MIFYVNMASYDWGVSIDIATVAAPTVTTKYIYQIEAVDAEQAFFKLTSGKREDYLYWSKLNGFVSKDDFETRCKMFEELMDSYKDAKAEYEMDVKLDEYTQK